MKIIITIFFTIYALLSFAQEKGSLMHYQKKCTDCLSLAGENYNSKNFFIIVSDSVYSGGQITIKKAEQKSFTAKKVRLVFGANSYSLSQFFITGKKNIAAYELWVQSKIKPDPNGNSSLKIINDKTVLYSAVKKGSKLYVNAETTN
jgi:hypothetical protein